MVAIRTSNNNGADDNEFEELSRKSNKLTVELEDLIAEFNLLNSTMAIDSSKLKELKSELVKNDMEAKVAYDVILSYKNMKTKLGNPDEIIKELDFLDKRLSILKEDEEKIKADITNIETLTHNENLTIEELKTRLQSHISSILINTSQKESLSEQVHQLQEIAAVFIQAEKLENEQETLNDEYNECISNLDTANRSLSRETDLVKSLNSIVSNYEALCKELEEKTRGVDELTLERAALRSEFEFVSPQVDSLEQQIKDLRMDLEAKQKELDTLAANNVQSKEELKLIDAEIVSKDNEILSVAAQQARHSDLTGVLEKTLNGLRETYMHKLILDNELQAIDSKMAIIAQVVRL
ncbi:MAG: hypothetical protein HQL06_03020 [Nitrospirae bacterium]|nr:hypothetical protein [Nitrospirota bacterium]